MLGIPSCPGSGNSALAFTSRSYGASDSRGETRTFPGPSWTRVGTRPSAHSYIFTVAFWSLSKTPIAVSSFRSNFQLFGVTFHLAYTRLAASGCCDVGAAPRIVCSSSHVWSRAKSPGSGVFQGVEGPGTLRDTSLGTNPHEDLPAWPACPVAARCSCTPGAAGVPGTARLGKGRGHRTGQWNCQKVPVLPRIHPFVLNEHGAVTVSFC